MGSEFGLAVIIALLWGPTAVWLFYVTARGRSPRITSVVNALINPNRGSELAPDNVQELVAKGEFWICDRCRSVNASIDRYCYSCHVQKEAPSPEETDEVAADATPAARPLVPVMAAETVQSARAGSARTLAAPVAGNPAPARAAVGPASLPGPTGRRTRASDGSTPAKPKKRAHKAAAPLDPVQGTPGAMVPIWAHEIGGARRTAAVGGTAEPEQRPQRSRRVT